MSDTEPKPADAAICTDSRRNFFEAVEEEEPLPDPRMRLLLTLTDTGDILEDIEEHCVALVRAIECSSLTAGDATRLKKRVWRIEDLSIKAAARINGRHANASF